MLKYILDQYQKICEDTFYNFELYHLNALNSLVGEDIGARDLQMLSLIATSNPPATPKLLADTFFTKNSAISNRLAFFEQKGFIERTKSSEDSRNVDITLTPLGLDQVAINNNYYKSYAKYVRSTFTLKDLLTTITTINKFKKIILNSKDDDKKYTSDKVISSDMFLDLYNYFSNLENEFIRSKKIDEKQRDLFVLTEIYAFLSQGKSNLTELAEHLFLPYQTLISKIRKFKNDNILLKIDDNYSLSTDYERLVVEYIYFRTIIYYETMSHFNPSEQKVILSLFTKLREHALSFKKV